jgi:hypothetical protein
MGWNVPVLPKSSPISRSFAISYSANAPFSTVDSALVDAPTHTPSASRAVLPPGSLAAHTSADDRLFYLPALPPVDSIPSPPHQYSARLCAAYSSRSLALPTSPLVLDNDNTLPTPDAIAASSTTLRSLLYSARPPTLPARTTCELQRNLAGPEIAAGFELRQTAPLWPLQQPFF